MSQQAQRDAAAPGARPECKHGNTFVGLYGETLHMICQCAPDPAAVREHAALRAKGWFLDVPKRGEDSGKSQKAED